MFGLSFSPAPVPCRPLGAALTGSILLGLLTACSTAGSTPAASGSSSAAAAVPACTGSPGAQTIPVVEREYSVAPCSTSLSAGSVTFQALNQGTTEHELVLMRTDTDPSTILVDPATQTIDEDAAGEHIDEVEEVAPGAGKAFTASLSPGTYVLFCNTDGHYQAGMHTQITVK